MADPPHIDLIDALLARLVGWILDHRWLAALTSLIVLISVPLLASNLQADNSLNAYFVQDDPAYQRYKAFRDTYNNDEFVYLVYTASPGIFDLRVLEKTRELVEDLETIPYVEDVTAITNLEFLEGGSDDSLDVFGLMDGFPTDQAEANRLKRKLLQHPLYRGTYISDDAQYGAIICDAEARPDDDFAYQSTIGARLHSVLAKPAYGDFQFWPVGQPIIVSAINEVAAREVYIFTGVVAVIITALLLVFFRQLKGIVALQLCYVLGLAVVVLALSLSDSPLTMLSLVAFPILYAIAVADGVHVVHEYQTHLRAGDSNRESILNAVKLIGAACLLTTLTTAAGFASVTISPLPIVAQFGLSTAVGVVALFISCFTILPAVLSVSGDRSEALYSSDCELSASPEAKFHGVLDRFLVKIARWDIEHHRVIVLIAVLCGAASVYGAARIKTDASWLNYFGDEIPVFQDYTFVDGTMAGSSNFEVLVDSGKPDGVATLRLVHTLEQIQKYAESQDYIVRKTISVIDIVKDISKALHGNDPSYYTLPASDPELAQYLLLYEISGGEELEQLVSGDLATARLTILVRSTNTSISKRFYDDLVVFIESVIPDDYAFEVTGLSHMQLESLRQMNVAMMWSIALALAIVSLLMIVVFRSLKIGLISMLPNVFPVIATLGIMGLAGIPLDFSKTVLACVAIGIAVDDTIHLLSRYRREFRVLGNYELALEAAMRGVGHAITKTTIILVIPLAACMFSNFATMAYFGMLMSICIVIALLGDYFLAPSLILALRPFGEEFDRDPHGGRRTPLVGAPTSPWRSGCSRSPDRGHKPGCPSVRM